MAPIIRRPMLGLIPGKWIPRSSSRYRRCLDRAPVGTFEPVKLSRLLKKKRIFIHQEDLSMAEIVLVETDPGQEEYSRRLL